MNTTISRALVLAFALGVLGSLSVRVAADGACDNPGLTPEEIATCQAQNNAINAQNAINQAQNTAQEQITQAQLQDAGPQESSGGGGCS